MIRQREMHGLPPYLEGRSEISISSGDNTIITGVAGRYIRIYMLVLWARAATDVIIKDGSTTVNGLGFNFSQGGGGVFDFPNRPLTLAVGNSLVINTSGALTGWVEYTQTGLP